MVRSASLNLAIAAIWLLLQSELTLSGFFLGFVLGFGLIALFREVLHSHDYVRRMVAGVRFAGVFTQAFLLSSFQVLRISLFSSMRSLNPRIITYDIEGLTKLETLLLSHAISLTPGTTTVAIGAGFRYLILHVLEADNPDEVRDSIDRTLKRGILAFTR